MVGSNLRKRDNQSKKRKIIQYHYRLEIGSKSITGALLFRSAPLFVVPIFLICANAFFKNELD